MSAKVVTIHEAKTHLSKIIQDVVNGQEVIIAKGKTPMVKLVVIPPQAKRKIGNFEGQIETTEDFDETLEDFADYTG